MEQVRASTDKHAVTPQSDSKFKSVTCAPKDETDPNINETKDFSC